MKDGRYNVPVEHDFSAFKTRLRELIDGRGINVAQTALGAKINKTSMSRYFSDRTPDIIAVWRLADFFNVSIDWLLGRTDERFSHLPSKPTIILSKKYEVASDDDKLIIDTLLSKYEV